MLSPAVEMFVGEGGRGLRAKRPIKRGEMILEEKPFVSTLKKAQFNFYCYHCLNPLPEHRAFPCQNCTQVFFCDHDCAADCWEQFHSIECGSIDMFVLNKNFQYPPIMTLHILAKEGLNGVIKGAKLAANEEFVTEGYEAVHSLIQHQNEENDYDPIAELIISFLKRKGQVGVIWKREHETLVKEIVSLLRKIQVNAIEINAKEFKPESKLEDLRTVDVEDIGCGLYLTFRFFNHSCYPNVCTGYFDGSSILVRAVRDIAEGSLDQCLIYPPINVIYLIGEELFICYGAHHKWQTRVERQKLLKESYHFDCNCEACRKNLQPVNKAFLCPNCKGPVICESKDMICLKCGLKNHLDLESSLAEAGPCFKLSQMALKCMESGKEDQLAIAEETLSESAILLNSILYPMHIELGKLLEKQRLCYKLTKSWTKAVKVAEKHFLLVKGETDQLDLAGLNEALKLIDVIRLSIKSSPEDRKMRQKHEKYLKEAIHLRDLFLHPTSAIYQEISQVLMEPI